MCVLRLARARVDPHRGLPGGGASLALLVSAPRLFEPPADELDVGRPLNTQGDPVGPALSEHHARIVRQPFAILVDDLAGEPKVDLPTAVQVGDLGAPEEVRGRALESRSAFPDSGKGDQALVQSE